MTFCILVLILPTNNLAISWITLHATEFNFSLINNLPHDQLEVGSTTGAPLPRRQKKKESDDGGKKKKKYLFSMKISTS